MTAVRSGAASASSRWRPAPPEKALIEWVARHPLLSKADLAALLDTSEALIERRLEWLTRCGAIRSAATTNG